MLVKPAGHKWWRFKYRYGARADGKSGKAEKVLALGVFPDVSLKRAREKRDDARRLLADGIDPSAQRKADDHAHRLAHLRTFEAIAREWLGRQSWGDNHSDRNTRRLEQHVFPWIGATSYRRRKTRRAARDSAGGLRGRAASRPRTGCCSSVSAIFEYANAEEICEHTPCTGLSKTLLPRPNRHHASITDPKQVGELLRAIDGFGGTFPVACALRLAPLLFVRPGELRRADWSEFDLERHASAVADTGEPDEDARAAHRPACKASRRHPAGPSSAHRSDRFRVSRAFAMLPAR